MSGLADKRIVLVADDDPEVLEFLKTVIEKKGYEVVTAVNGREAIEKVSLLQPDLIVTDINMPEVDGYSVTKQIKSNDLLKRIKVIVITAQSNVAGREGAKKARADAFLHKPVDSQRLWDLMEDLLEKQDKESPNLIKKLDL